ncbi:hypothetical protein JND46_15245, partial [Listeria monocytogenes]|nr:hypothetical protein [Listeria monocytogenes]
GAGAAERQGDGATDATGGPGDQNDLAGERETARRLLLADGLHDAPWMKLLLLKRNILTHGFVHCHNPESFCQETVVVTA